MNRRRSTRALAAGILSAAGLTLSLAAPAAGGTVTETVPQTPENNDALPLIHVDRDSASVKANILNPRPVCNAWEDRRTVVYEVRDDFAPVGTVSMTNDTDSTLPLTQETSRSQTIALSVNGSQTSTTSFNSGGTATGEQLSGNAGIAFSLARTFGGDASYSLTWNVGQTVGPYDVPAGHTGEATYGFRTVSMTGTQQYCKLDGTWSTPTAWRAFVPVKNELRVSLYANPVDSPYAG